LADLGGKAPKYFDPWYEIAQSWIRLIDGKDIQPHDIILIEHELMESKLMTSGLKYQKAHDKTDETHNYFKAVTEYRMRE